MPLEFRFSCPLPNGLHARPASILAELATRFNADIRLLNERNNNSADVASVLDLVAAGVMHTDICLLRVDGRDSQPAYNALVEFITSSLADCDTPLPEANGNMGGGQLPHVLRGQVDNWLGGLAASSGIAIANAARSSGMKLPAGFSLPASLGEEAELAAYEKASAAVQQHHEEQLERCIGMAEVEIQRALLSLARDRSLHDSVRQRISEKGDSAAQAVAWAIRSYSEKLTASGSVYLQERRGDLEDLGIQLLEELTGQNLHGHELVLTEPSIVCAASLPTSTMLALDKKLLKGIVLGESGLTSHTVILARSHGIPVVAGISDQSQLANGMPLYIDGNRGVVVLDPPDAVQRYVEQETKLESQLRKGRNAAASLSGKTADGRAVEIAANVAAPDELAAALASGAEGVGLFRTEMLFAASASMPGEDEQARIYAEMAVAMKGRRLIIRTVDIGGDKPLPWLPMPHEENPFLGVRGIRLSQRYPEMMKTQLRAILRASTSGEIWVMAPMLANVAEARWLREIHDAARAELIAEGCPVSDSVRLGCMLEVPAAALQVPALSAYCDFFSIGSNDLAQYSLAVDRGNRDVAAIHDELHPSLLRLMKIACDDARASSRWIGICGEFAARPLHAPFLAGLGFDELSMSAPAIPAAKQALAACSLEQGRELLDRCIAAEDGNAVRQILHAASGSTEAPMIAPAIVNPQGKACSKSEAIRELCGMLLLDGRTADIDGIEDDVWAREETYSTGLGHGIAIPHCKTEHAGSASLALLRLPEAVEWGSLDNAPVDTVLLLAMPAAEEGNRHLKVFARLARRLMNEDFRSGLRAAETADNIVQFLQSELRENEE
ncbi:MAG: phosphoenolpyruvate--protein phosphotransferase [Planctomycetales bacterium]|nr:phosphoenolpyruvate--protein phosphotransferase [bacterium]UNM08140.1 MAG: phosphoenolpyruvate--protein phosphotransferase [Planctomycetales bacterium]